MDMADVNRENMSEILKKLARGIAFSHRYTNHLDLHEILEKLEEAIVACHKSSTIYNQTDFPDQWAENQNVLSKLQELVVAEIERERLIVTRSLEYQELQNSQEIGRDMYFQDRRFFDFTVKSIHSTHLNGKGIDDCSAYNFIDLSGANLSGTHTNRTRMIYAKLVGANLSNICWIVTLTGADLSHANLLGSRLSGDLNAANLSDANLCDANLSYTQLIGANFTNANLCNADLGSADLDGANFSNANVKGTKFGRNSGIYPTLKQDLIARGAIFKEGKQ
jgi:uncharacterized protein YjbI with pentapeptide repeats